MIMCLLRYRSLPAQHEEATLWHVTWFMSCAARYDAQGTCYLPIYSFPDISHCLSTTHVLIGKATIRNHTWKRRHFLNPRTVPESLGLFRHSGLTKSPSPRIIHANKSSVCVVTVAQCPDYYSSELSWSLLKLFAGRGGGSFKWNTPAPILTPSRLTLEYFSWNTSRI